MSDYHLRLARESDVPALSTCLHEAFAPFREEYSRAAYANTVPSQPELLERVRTMSVWVVIDRRGVLVGTVSASRRSPVEGHLRGMAVRPDRQGSGVADALLDRAVKSLAALGCRKVTLDTTRPLARARRFYEKHGFSATGTVTDFFGMPLLEYARALV